MLVVIDGGRMIDLEEIIDWQQRGINARVVGLAVEENPLLKLRPVGCKRKMGEWQLKSDAWLFGWTIEDQMRRSCVGYYYQPVGTILRAYPAPNSRGECAA